MNVWRKTSILVINYLFIYLFILYPVSKKSTGETIGDTIKVIQRVLREGLTSAYHFWVLGVLYCFFFHPKIMFGDWG